MSSRRLNVHLCSLMGGIEQTNCLEEATIKGIIIGLRFGFLRTLIAEQGALHAVVLHFCGGAGSCSVWLCMHL